MMQKLQMYVSISQEMFKSFEENNLAGGHMCITYVNFEEAE